MYNMWCSVCVSYVKSELHLTPKSSMNSFCSFSTCSRDSHCIRYLYRERTPDHNSREFSRNSGVAYHLLPCLKSRPKVTQLNGLPAFKWSHRQSHT